MAAGLGFKTFTTGEVLTAADTNGYLMQGVLVFASAAARDAAITSPQEGQCCYLKDTDAVLTYSGSAWVGFDDSNAIQNSIVDAKGDLVAASAADTPARLAVGSNGETLVADSSTSTGLIYTEPKVANPVLNSSFQIAQRGTTFTSPSAYTLDRWYWAGGNACSQQTTSDTTNLPNIQFCARVGRSVSTTATGTIYFSQSLETVNSRPFAGKTVIVSYYARRGANYSGSGNTVNLNLTSGTGTDQNVIVAYTGGSTVASANATLTTTWQRFTTSGTVPTTSTELAMYFSYTTVGTAGAADYFEVTGVQIDIGTVALPFRTNGATIQGELAACQRYYEKGAKDLWSGNTTSGSTYYQNIRYAVTKRSTPTVTIVSSYLLSFPSISTSELQIWSFRISGTANATGSGVLSAEEWNASAEL
jgi:hypothetical protein